MNIENLASYLNSQEPFNDKVQSEIMQLLEKHPYFQIAHMLLLKSMHQIQPESYNNQLKISGSFISDKRKLFQFINTDITVAFEKKVEEKKEEIVKKEITSIEKRIPTKEPFEKKEEKAPVIKTIEKTEEKKIEKDVTNKVITETKEIKRQPVRTKVDLPEGEIEKNADKNSKHKHNKIIKDFFHSTEEKKALEQNQQGGKSSVIEKQEVKKDIPVIKKDLPEEKKVIREIKREVPLEKNIVREIKKESPIKKVVSEVKISEKAPVNKIEPTKEKIVERKSEPETLISKKEVENPQDNKTGKESDTMNNIFSKIRQIKKEMNINSESTPKTIDIKTQGEVSQSNKTETRKSSSGRVIKESFIGFDEQPVKEEQEPISKEKAKKTESFTQDEGQNTIKESEYTAKDLFKKHKLQKEKSTFLEAEEVIKNEHPEKTSTSPISKLVEIVNDETTKNTEPIKEQGSIEEKRETPITFKKESIKKEETSTSTGNESIADAMLRRIAEKKRRMQQEKLDEERKQEEERKKELDAVNELIKTSSKKDEGKLENNLIIEEKIEDANSQKEELTEQKMEVPPKKTNKLIDSFIEKADSLERIGTKETKLSGDVSIESTVESEGILTETYADLLIDQKKYEKAIEVYNKLILKFPEKKTYFAIQIKKVESLIK